MHDELPRAAMRRVISSLALTIAMSMMLSACQTVPDVHAVCPLDTTGVLVGRVEADSGIVGPFVVVARERPSGKIAHRMFVDDTRAFAMLMDAGRYDFFAFSERAGNGRRGPLDPPRAAFAFRSHIRLADLVALPALRIDVPTLTTDR